MSSLLSVDPRVLAAAEQYAAAVGTSVSQLVDYLAALVEAPSSKVPAPVLERLRGSMRGVEPVEHRRHLVRKYTCCDGFWSTST